MLSETAALPWRRIVSLFVVTRLLAVGWIVVSACIFAKSDFASVAEKQYPHPMMRWDAAWYADIVSNGYSYTPGKQSNVAFFPLYPMSARAFAWTGMPTHWAMMLVSNGSALLAALALWRVVSDGHGRACADDTVILLLCNPMTVFFMAGYTESTFMLLSVLAIGLIRRSPGWAAAAGCAAALTRSTGVLLAVPMAFEAMVVARERGERCVHGNVRLLAGAGPAAGLLIWCAYLYLTFGNGLAFAGVQPAWGHRARPMWETFGPQIDNAFYRNWFLFFAVGSVLLLAAGAWLRLHWTWNVYAILSMFVFFQSGSPESTPRYEFGVFTIYPAAALICRRFSWMRPILVSVFIALALASLTLFTRGYWFT